MIQIGCLARFFNSYEAEVKFAAENGFDFMQLWYDRNGLALNKDPFPKECVVKEINFPTIIHAVLDINEFKEHIPRIIDMLIFLEHKELIIHPICESEAVAPDTIHKLSKQVKYALERLQSNGITLYLENNSKLDPIFNTPQEIETVFNDNPDLEFLLDVAHIESYEHLQGIVNKKMPKVLHIADKHFDVIHEHLPIRQGDLDYEYIFKNILIGFEGKVILEVIQSDEAIVESKNILLAALEGCK